MKLTFIMLFISVSGLFASVRSQTARVNIQATNANTKTILNEIEKQTDYLFVYDANDIDMNRPASIQVNNATVASVLTSLFNNTNVVYAMEGNNIFLMKRVQSAAVYQQNGHKITGKVLDKNGEPIIGANVVVKGTTNGTITDLDGNFSLEASRNVELIFNDFCC